jgi:hypothetical protein
VVSRFERCSDHYYNSFEFDRRYLRYPSDDYNHCKYMGCSLNWKSRSWGNGWSITATCFLIQRAYIVPHVFPLHHFNLSHPLTPFYRDQVSTCLFVLHFGRRSSDAGDQSLRLLDRLCSKRIYFLSSHSHSVRAMLFTRFAAANTYMGWNFDSWYTNIPSSMVRLSLWISYATPLDKISATVVGTLTTQIPYCV